MATASGSGREQGDGVGEALVPGQAAVVEQRRAEARNLGLRGHDQDAVDARAARAAAITPADRRSASAWRAAGS